MKSDGVHSSVLIVAATIALPDRAPTHNTPIETPPIRSVSPNFKSSAAAPSIPYWIPAGKMQRSGGGGRADNNTGPGAVAMEAQVFVKNLSGKTLAIDVDLERHTVLDVKRVIEDREKILPEAQRLIYCGKVLEDASLLKESKVGNHATLHLVVRLPGGW